MPGNLHPEFGARCPPAEQPPVKRSGHVALLLMGTIAIGGAAYALMPPENCAPDRPGIAASGQARDCSPLGSSSGSGGGHGSWGGGSSSRTSFFGGDSSSGQSASPTSDAGSGQVTRGGFGSFARAFASHFSGGG
jgi:hypothetical protein